MLSINILAIHDTVTLNPNIPTELHALRMYCCLLTCHNYAVRIEHCFWVHAKVCYLTSMQIKNFLRLVTLLCARL